MCGRFVVAAATEDLIDLFDVEQPGEDLPEPSYNIRPTDRIPVVIESIKTGPVVRRLESARWSFVPSFSKELKTAYPTFNARSEEAASKTMFRASVASKRAIIPATGYYEWHTVGKTKTPYYIHQAGAALALAGLYSWWKNPAATADDPSRWVLTATILTRKAVGGLVGIHERTPVTLPRELWDGWLDPHTTGDQALVDAAVQASAAVPLEFYEVSPLAENGPELIEPRTP